MLFTCQPSELRFVNSPTDYFWFFTRLFIDLQAKLNTKYNREDIDKELLKCGWVDGLECQWL